MYAGFWTRFAAAFIDGLILLIPNLIIGFIFGAILGAGRGNSATTASLSAIRVIPLLITWLYYAYFESSEKQATPGKMLMKIAVTDLNGQRLSFMQAFLRNASKLLSSICLIGYIMAAFTEKKQGLHDMLAGTLVVNQVKDAQSSF